jgi:hypothetical protein
LKLGFKIENSERFYWNLATSSANLASIVSEVSEELEAFTSGIEKSLTADDGQHPPAGSFRLPEPSASASSHVDFGKNWNRSVNHRAKRISNPKFQMRRSTSH